ncbi:zinc knuckle [Ancylostoma ceylanicum]|uniref:Zinc knuckle n=1 Tax=Ancylostoma ceylanicum TaxID=53326 RepID=A0A0D6LHB6_9BILA|nr:zinc knuckle [Ancylostoma ceylanicum]
MDKDNIEDLPGTSGQTALPERSVRLLSEGDISAIIAAIRVEQHNPCSSKSQPTPSTSFTRKGFASQFEFNDSIITKLSSINKRCIPKEVEDIIQSAVDTLKTRNETLKIADKHPGVFAFLDNKRQADEIKSSDPHLAEYLEQIGKEEKANKRKRTSSPQLIQPFPARVSAWSPGTRRFSLPRRSYYFSQRSRGQYGYAPRSFNSGPTRNRYAPPTGPCFICGHEGHWYNECPQNPKCIPFDRAPEPTIEVCNDRSALQQPEFVSTTISELLDNGAVYHHVKKTRNRSSKISANVDGFSQKKNVIGAQAIKETEKDKRRSRAVESAVAEAQSKSGVLSRKESTPLIKQMLGKDVPYGPLWTEAQALIHTAREYGVPEIGEAIDTALSSHRAESTIASYIRQVQQFLDWWKSSSLSGIPVSKARNMFLAHCSAENRFKSIPAAVAAFNFFLGKQQGPDRDIEKSLIDSSMRRKAPTKHRSKITPQDYSLIISKGFQSSEESVRTTAAIAVFLFRGFLRINEARSLLKDDVTFEGSSISVFVRKSKTDQTSKGESITFCLDTSSIEYQLVLNHYQSLCDSNQFLFPSHSTKSPLTLATISDRLHDLFRLAGLEHKAYTSHSFRGGAATAALTQGVDGNRIMAMGRWKSAKAFQAYVHPSPIPISVPFPHNSDGADQQSNA